MDLHNGVLIHRAAPVDGADLILRLPRRALPQLLAGSTEGMEVEGDTAVLRRFMAVLETPDPSFDIVTP